MAKAGDFITITARRVSDKIQPELKVGGIYHVNSVGQLKNGKTVLILDKNPAKHLTVRCNAERFKWEVITPKEVQERNFKAECKKNTKRLMEAFSFEEHAKIAFVPLIIAHIAWYYADKAVRYAADHRISEVKKLSRAIKELRTHYIDLLKKDLDYKHLEKIQLQADRFMQEYRFDFIVLQHSTANDINYQHVGISYDDLRVFAFLSKQFIRECKKHEDRMTALIRERLGEAKEAHLPTLDTLYTCMDAFLGDYEIKETQNMRNNMIVFHKNLDEIEFELNDCK